MILHYFIALREGISTVKLVLSNEKDSAFIQCPDCGPPQSGVELLNLRLHEQNRKFYFSFILIFTYLVVLTVFVNWKYRIFNFIILQTVKF